MEFRLTQVLRCMLEKYQDPANEKCMGTNVMDQCLRLIDGHAPLDHEETPEQVYASQVAQSIKKLEDEKDSLNLDGWVCPVEGSCNAVQFGDEKYYQWMKHGANGGFWYPQTLPPAPYDSSGDLYVCCTLCRLNNSCDKDECPYDCNDH